MLFQIITKFFFILSGAEIQYIYFSESSYLSIKESKINRVQTSPKVIKQTQTALSIWAPFLLSGIEICTAWMTCDVCMLLPTFLIPALLNSMISQLFNFFLSIPKALLCASNYVIDSAVVVTTDTFLLCAANLFIMQSH